jgi:N-acyl-D-aspartate/D-glutamate deacylase
MSDLIVRGGTVVDGTGGPSRAADVRVRDGVIVEVAPDLAPDGEHEIDARGAVVAPGFVDSHTHYDIEMFWDPSLDPLPGHGITTIVMGNCGLGIAPVAPEVRDDIVDLLSSSRSSRLRSPSRTYRGVGRAGPSTPTVRAKPPPPRSRSRTPRTTRCAPR